MTANQRILCARETCRFQDYDGAMLEEFVYMRNQAPDTLYNALLKDKISVADILKINRAVKQLYK